MSRTRIKICGICRPQDAVAAAEAGADAIGMVFHPASPRYLSLEQAEQIAAVVPPFVSILGLFVDVHLSVIQQTMQRVPLSAVQLHGTETPKLVADLKPTRVIKVLRIRDDKELIHWRNAIAEHQLTNLAGILLETPKAKTGGSGIENDWDTISALQSAGSFAGLPPMIAAGGLTPHNVTDVIRRLRPYAVDLSTGVEISPREKSPEKIRDFVRAVRAAENA